MIKEILLFIFIILTLLFGYLYWDTQQIKVEYKQPVKCECPNITCPEPVIVKNLTYDDCIKLTEQYQNNLKNIKEVLNNG